MGETIKDMAELYRHIQAQILGLLAIEDVENLQDAIQGSLQWELGWGEECKKLIRRKIGITLGLFGSKTEGHNVLDLEKIEEILKNDDKITTFRCLFHLDLDHLHYASGFGTLQTDPFQNINTLHLTLVTDVGIVSPDWLSFYQPKILQLVFPVIPNITSVTIKCEEDLELTRKKIFKPLLGVGQPCLAAKLLSVFPNTKSLIVGEDIKTTLLLSIGSILKNVTSLQIQPSDKSHAQNLVANLPHHSWARQLELTCLELDLKNDYHLWEKKPLCKVLFSQTETLKTLVLTRIPWKQDNYLKIPPMEVLEKLKLTHSCLDEILSIPIYSSKIFKIASWPGPDKNFEDYHSCFPLLTHLEISSSDPKSNLHIKEHGTVRLLQIFSPGWDVPSVVEMKTDLTAERLDECECGWEQQNFRKELCSSCKNWSRKTDVYFNLKQHFPNAANLDELCDLYDGSEDRVKIFNTIKNGLPSEYRSLKSYSENELSNWLHYEGHFFNNQHCRWNIQQYGSDYGLILPDHIYGHRHTFPLLTPTYPSAQHETGKSDKDRLWDFVERCSKTHVIFLTGPVHMNLNILLSEYLERIEMNAHLPPVIMRSIGDEFTIHDPSIPTSFPHLISSLQKLDVAEAKQLFDMSQEVAALFGEILVLPERQRWIVTHKSFTEFVGGVAKELEEEDMSWLAWRVAVLELINFN